MIKDTDKHNLKAKRLFLANDSISSCLQAEMEWLQGYLWAHCIHTQKTESEQGIGLDNEALRSCQRCTISSEDLNIKSSILFSQITRYLRKICQAHDAKKNISHLNHNRDLGLNGVFSYLSKDTTN